MGIELSSSHRRQFLASSLGTSALATFLAGATRLSSRRAVSASPEDPVDDYAARQLKHYAIPGLSVAVLREGRVVKNRGYGRASLEFDLPADGESVYQIASVSKIFAGVAVMLLVEDGRLRLDMPITEFSSRFPRTWAPIRVHHLLEHTSGLPAASDHPRMREEQEKRKDRLVGTDQLDTFTAAEIFDFVAELPLHFEPGRQWAYGQTGYQLLGTIVEIVSGKPFPVFLAERVFAPSGMPASHFGDSRVIVPRRPATAYSRQTGTLRNWIWPYSTTDYPAAGLNTSTTDLARFFQALLAGGLPTRASCDRMWARAALAEGKTAPYGLGWSIHEVGGYKAVGHEGGGCCWVAHLPELGLTAIALSNLAGARADETAEDIARLYLPRKRH